ncbi:MAG TPA: hypothetical protein VMH80_04465 [Bryobacteraceae bacterium]|nr:hypothetical protein [Bryobacteraceae bacterium]
MKLRLLTAMLAAAVSLTAQTNWKAPRTADGQPDLQGTWTNATLTPFQRPKELGNKEFFTPEEAAAFEKQRIQATDVDRVEGPRGAADLARRAYNNTWMDRGTHVTKYRRTSLVVDPPDGRVPPFTPEAQKRYDDFKAYLAKHASDGPEDRLLTERCILFGASGPPMLPEPYNNNYQIVQNRDSVTILAEMNHTARTIPLDGRPHVPAQITEWGGDSRGHWESDTLVVETTNFKFNNQSRFGVSYLDGMTDGNLRVVERFTRMDPETLIYRATIDDPTVYTKPWTVEISMGKRTEPLYEYACHEGNYAMADILRGARAEEKKANAAK